MSTCDEVIEETKTVLTKFNEKKQPVKHNISIFYLFLLITIALLVAVSIYCYLIKYRAKQKHLLPHLDKFDINKCIIKIENNDKLKEIDIFTRYYFDDIIKVKDLDRDNILIDQKLYENILAYNILCKKFDC